MTTETIDLKPIRVRSLPTLEEAITAVGALKARNDEVTAERDQRIAEIKAQYTTEIEELDRAIDKQVASIGPYVTANAEALFGKKKSTQLAAGKVALVKGRTVAKVTDEETAIEWLKAKRGKVSACIAKKFSLVKTELAKQQPDIPGVSYERTRERLQITPTNLGTVISSELNQE